MPADLGPSGEADAEHPSGPRSDDGPLNGEMPSTSDSAASGPPADGGAALDARIAALGAAYDSRIDAAALTSRAQGRGCRLGRRAWQRRSKRSGRPCRIAAGEVVAGGRRRSKRRGLLDRASGRPGLAFCCGESPARARQQWPRSGGCSPGPSACPTVPSARFTDTVTAIERRVNREADVLVVIDDPASYSLVVTGCRCVW
jgi:hypothetical protein